MAQPFGMPSLTLYLILIAAVALERLVELLVDRRNRRRLESQGAVEVGRGHYPVMVLLHASILVAAPLEAWLLDRPFRPLLALAAALVLVGTMSLRYWVIATLGDRWSTRILVLPEAPPVTGGPYRWLRHPNYLAVIAELLALPLFHGAWLTAAAFSLANAWLLRVRIRAEERALRDRGSSYGTLLGDRPRLLPAVRG